MNDKALTIYKASAGSGKTFTLSAEYIKLLILNPNSYRSTLAVTFTNKATEEMKMRILSQLYGIWKQLPDSKGYADKIKKELGIGDKMLTERAGIALHNIVSNYSYFRIETIDSFFQSVLRNLARELDLTANLKVELNDEDIESNAVDQLITELREKDDFLKWIMDFIQENIDEEHDWNVIGNIKEFGKNIFKEFYKTHSKELNKKLAEKGFFGRYTHMLRQLRDNAKKDIQTEAERFFQALEERGYTVNDLSNKTKGVARYFIKIRNGVMDDSILTKTAVGALNGETDKWVTGSAPQDLRDFATGTLAKILEETEEVRSKRWRTYQSAALTLRNINQLRLLNSIDTKVREMNMETNRFLLSDTHSLLHSLIQDSDSPFIFEKIGTRLETIMIDEFQDTSVIQWQNFKVLLEECMSNGETKGNLIVGDVKQSIYRWRSGDWRMLNNIETEFPGKNDMLKLEPLDTNWRSQRNVIVFNNAFFKAMADVEYDNLTQLDSSDNGILRAEQLKKAYSDVEQKVAEKKKEALGRVEITLLPGNKGNNSNEEMMEMVKTNIESLLSQGAALADIAIIARSNNTLQAIADYLAMELPTVRLVSNEAYRLDSSMAVEIIVNAMRYLVDTDNAVTAIYLQKAILTHIMGKTEEEANSIIAKEGSFAETLPAEYLNNLTELVCMPLYDLAEHLYNIFHLQTIEGEDAYLFKFFDLLADFIVNNTADINTFINEWDSSFYKKTIPADSIDGIQLITIHKSKGLEFEHVIMPFCDWQIEKSGTIWCSPKDDPFDALPVLPVPFNSKQMQGTIYEEDYYEEHLQNMVDNLNMLYVGFTRASSSLIVFGKRGNSLSRSSSMEQALFKMDLPGSVIEGTPGDNKSTMTFTYGETYIAKEHKHEASANIFLPKKEKIEAAYRSYEGKGKFRQSNKSQDFITPDDNVEEKQKQTYIKTGRLLHKLFATIKTKADICPAIDELVAEGVLDDETMTAEQLRKMVEKRMTNKQVAEWFEDKWTLFNECSILLYDKATDTVTERRPDRVMKDGERIVVVDFKFGNPAPEYIDQVRNYMAIMKNMGYADVKGYLWYVYSNTIEEVRL